MITIDLCGVDSEQGEHESRLINKLIEEVNQYARPVLNEMEAVNVAFGLSLSQIIDVVRSPLYSESTAQTVYSTIDVS